MDTAAYVLLYVAAGCLVVLTAMLCAFLYVALRAVFEARRFLARIGRETERVFFLQRKIERNTRLAGKWFAHLPGRLFEAWGERNY
jgi:hypothetical protein